MLKALRWGLSLNHIDSIGSHHAFLHFLNRLIHFEMLAWVSGLIFLALSDPLQAHFTICPLANLGISWCPGCGLGHAVAHLFNGNVQASFMAHPLGIPAVIVLGLRIRTLWNRPL